MVLSTERAQLIRRKGKGRREVTNLVEAIKSKFNMEAVLARIEGSPSGVESAIQVRSRHWREANARSTQERFSDLQTDKGAGRGPRKSEEAR